MDLSQYGELFLAESREHLNSVNQHLLEWERNPEATEPVDGIFRAVHTIKGMAATMGYAVVRDLAHRAEVSPVSSSGSRLRLPAAGAARDPLSVKRRRQHL